MCTILGTKRIWARVAVVMLTVFVTVGVALPCFASDYPTPTPSPDPLETATATPTPTPYVESTPRLNTTTVPAIHVDGAISLYFLNFIVQTRWASGAILSDNTLETVSGVNYRTSTSDLSLDGVSMIALYNYGNDNWSRISRLLFLDSDKNPLAGGYFVLPSDTYSFSDIPSGASYVRVTIVGGYTGESAYQRYRVALSPTVHRLDDSEFWFTDITPHSFVRTDSGGIEFGFYATNYGCDEVFFDIRYSDSYLSATSVSCSILSEVRTQFYSGARYPVSYMDEDSTELVSVWAYCTPYYIDTIGDKIDSLYFSRTQSNNPFNVSCVLSDYKFSGLRANIPLNKPTGYAVGSEITITVSPLTLDSVEVVVDNIVYDSKHKLDKLGDDLAVPLPSFSVDNLLTDALSGADSSAASSIFNIFFSNSLVVQMLLMTVTFALIGYIFFGKRGEE